MNKKNPDRAAPAEGPTAWVNNSEGKPYYSQRNNRIKPGTACNVTSIISALSAAGWPVDKLAKNGEQPEDSLMRFLLTDPLSLAKWKRIDPNGNYPPNEWHSILADGANRFVAQMLGGDEAWDGLNAVTFTEYADAEVIAAAIRNGGAAAVSGLFMLPDGRRLSHVVSLVGVVGGAYPSGFVVDDPWGDYHNGYESQNGNDVRMGIEDFISIIKFPGQDRKMAHLVRRYS